MQVTVIENQEIIWGHNANSYDGIASCGYLKDGTQQKIITALEDALIQANAQLLSRNNGDGVTDACTPPAKV